ncbi:MAG: hypothetical protein DGJ47_000120 [Rickettsiaceae bacterium]
MNYFTLLDMEEKYKIDSRRLKAQYLKALQLYHPDRAQIGEAKDYIERSMRINEAYKILSDDYERAKYILLQKGYDFQEESLRKVMSFDDLEGVLEDYSLVDNTNDILALKYKEKAKRGDIQDVVLVLNNSFEAGDFSKALDYTVRLKYLTNLVRNIKLKIKNANS